MCDVALAETKLDISVAHRLFPVPSAQRLRGSGSPRPSAPHPTPRPHPGSEGLDLLSQQRHWCSGWRALRRSCPLGLRGLLGPWPETPLVDTWGFCYGLLSCDPILYSFAVENGFLRPSWPFATSCEDENFPRVKEFWPEHCLWRGNQDRVE